MRSRRARDPNFVIRGFDADTLEHVKDLPLPDHIHGVSIDFHGNVWGVTVGSRAYRVDPVSGDDDVYEGLTGAYTYSDVTGFAPTQTAEG